MERLEELLIKDKFSNLNQVAEILKEEVLPIAQNFFVMKEDIVVRFKREGDGYVFNVEIPAQRIKPFGNKLFF